MQRHKVLAHALVAEAVRKGLLYRFQHCQDCAVRTNTKAHHEDYTKPLDVEWLCQRCHTYRHLPPPTERNWAMLAWSESHPEESYRQIGKHFGLSAERARQIILKTAIYRERKAVAR